MKFCFMLIGLVLVFAACSDDEVIPSSSNDSLPEMVVVPADTDGVSIGWSSVSTGSPVHTVASISSFMIGKYEVTYSLWTNVTTWATAHGYTFKSDSGYMGDGVSDTPDHPVTFVSHNDVLAWCNALSEKAGLEPVYYKEANQADVYRDSTDTTSTLVASGVSGANNCVKWSANGYRLPTEAEWEYASRRKVDGTLASGDKPSGYTGTALYDSANVLTEWGAYAWYSGNSGSSTKPVGQKLPNALGIYDMCGNVYEWCWDWADFAPSYTTASPYTDADTRGIASGVNRILRGGCWGYGSNRLFTSYRGVQVPEYRNDRFGFRLARKQ